MRDFILLMIQPSVKYRQQKRAIWPVSGEAVNPVGLKQAGDIAGASTWPLPRSDRTLFSYFHRRPIVFIMPCNDSLKSKSIVS